jgi:hypothetical protein
MIEVEPTATALTADLGQAGLHELLDRVGDLGLELVDIEDMPSLPSRAS